jgi:hypothetical protein
MLKSITHCKIKIPDYKYDVVFQLILILKGKAAFVGVGIDIS